MTSSSKHVRPGLPPTPDEHAEGPREQDAFGRPVSGPLAGIVVADFSRVLAGPYCTMLLADLGATVIKVESPSGDDTRAWMPPVRDGESTYYMSINRNKRSIALDFNDPNDLETAQRLVAGADVVIENFKPGKLERFGLDYASVVPVNPDVVYASVTGFGAAGGADLPGYDLMVQAISGLMDLTGSPDSEPYRSGVAIFDVITGLHTCIGILAALRERDRSGKGQRIETNLLSSAQSGLVNQTAGYLLSGSVPRRMGNEHPSIYPYGPFPTGAGSIIIAVGNDSQFRRFCDTIGRPDLADDARFSTAPNRSRNRQDLRPLLVAALQARSAQEWYESLMGGNIPSAPINDVAQGIDFARSIGLDPVVSVGPHGEQPGVRHPISFSRTRPSYDLVPPALDADREDILAWLGIGAALTPAQR
ncbi:CaiB/BaiF CoA transferase family protein [Arthrobacter sp. USHLN218]|uniref:CaiB/BaiF CoA transferase family protein n=1 Tax=Arthrobacter sp. USHLN218 TaxID=3081232 RepID=UPI00301A3FA7